MQSRVSRTPLRRQATSDRPRAIACGPLRHGIFPCPISSAGSSAFAHPACLRGALMVAASLHGNARTGSVSHLHALKRFVCPWFPDLVSLTVCPCTVLGLSRVSGDAEFRLDSSKSRTLESLLFHFLIRSRDPARRPHRQFPVERREGLDRHGARGFDSLNAHQGVCADRGGRGGHRLRTPCRGFALIPDAA